MLIFSIKHTSLFCCGSVFSYALNSQSYKKRRWHSLCFYRQRITNLEWNVSIPMSIHGSAYYVFKPLLHLTVCYVMSRTACHYTQSDASIIQANALNGKSSWPMTRHFEEEKFWEILRTKPDSFHINGRKGSMASHREEIILYIIFDVEML